MSTKYFKIVSTQANQTEKVIEAFLPNDVARLEGLNVFDTGSLLLQSETKNEGQLWYWSGTEIRNKIHPHMALYGNKDGTFGVGYRQGNRFTRHGLENFCLVQMIFSPNSLAIVEQSGHPNQKWRIKYVDSPLQTQLFEMFTCTQEKLSQILSNQQAMLRNQITYGQMRAQLQEQKNQLRTQGNRMNAKLQEHRDQMRVMMQLLTELQISQAKATRSIQQQVWSTSVWLKSGFPSILEFFCVVYCIFSY